MCFISTNFFYRPNIKKYNFFLFWNPNHFVKAFAKLSEKRKVADLLALEISRTDYYQVFIYIIIKLLIILLIDLRLDIS